MRDSALLIAPTLVVIRERCRVLRNVSDFLHDPRRVKLVVSIVRAVECRAPPRGHLIFTADRAATLQRSRGITILRTGPVLRQHDQKHRRRYYLDHFTYEFGEPVFLAPT